VKDLGLDNFKRTLVYIIQGSTPVNEAIVTAGMAWHYVKYSKDPKLADAASFRIALAICRQGDDRRQRTYSADVSRLDRFFGRPLPPWWHRTIAGLSLVWSKRIGDLSILYFLGSR